MALDKQVNIYSVDTSAFYDSYESSIATNTYKLKKEKSRLENYSLKLDKMYKQIQKEKSKDEKDACLQRYNNFKNIILTKLAEIEKVINKTNTYNKTNLVSYFEKRRTFSHTIRNIKKSTLIDKNVISIFSSALTRMIGMNDSDKVYDDLIVVRAYYFDVLEDLISEGFIHNEEKYIYFTSSAGQIRTKKAVFIKEKLYTQHVKTIMCGLDLDLINTKGGININKYLAYTALISSATDVWDSFDIDKSIVVDDFETMYEDNVDYINYETYEITRKKMPVLIPHTDGCGIMLNETTTMVRLPFIKGLMINCQFDKFIRENIRKGNKECGKVIDIYGKQYDILEDGIKYIFTKSQFKLWKYYNSWDEYKTYFKMYACEACKCNEEEDEIKDAKINYQMLQTLSDMTDDEILEFSKKTIEEIKNIGTDKDAMLSILGVTEANDSNLSYLQKVLKVYPEILQDIYCKEVVKQTKASIVKEARSGKIKVNGKYTFVCPDVYAFMEWLFLKDENPKGLLKTGEVYCDLFDNDINLNCLRAPHLFLEYAIRVNTKTEEMKRWFKGNSIYISNKDLITKILQLDVDGDKLLVIEDELQTKIAKRNIKKYDIVPLYYEMQKADAQIINNKSIFDSLILAFTGGNIGIISNNISKMWNSFGRIEENDSKNKRIKIEKYNYDTLKAIKLMCMENNFVIDYAKTLFKPTRPEHIDKLITSYTCLPLPHFFKYAKDKTDKQVDDLNYSTVNRFEKIIPNTRMSFTATKLGKFDYKMLMDNLETQNDTEVIEKYKDLNRNKKLIAKEQWERKNRNYYVDRYIKNELLKINHDEVYVTDVLTKYLYEHNSVNKNTLWNSFGHILIENLMKNLPKKSKMCEVCGKRFVINDKDMRSKLCDDCFAIQRKLYLREAKRKARCKKQ